MAFGDLVGLSLSQLLSAQGNIFSATRDPTPLVCGAIAGGVGRALTLPFDMGGKKGVAPTIMRRIPQYGLLLGLYVPATAAINYKVDQPETKMMTTFMCGALAGFYMRLWTNPINRVCSESARTGAGFIDTAKALKAKTILQFWYTGHPLFSNAFYFGTLMTCFEGTRRFLERNGAPTGSPLANAATNGTAGAVGAFVASTVAYPFSAHTYRSTVIHPSVVCRGLGPTLLKEVPLSFFVFGTFSFLQSAVSSRHAARGGFGYSKN